jgi:hypothetical protein
VAKRKKNFFERSKCFALFSVNIFGAFSPSETFPQSQQETQKIAR